MGKCHPSLFFCGAAEAASWLPREPKGCGTPWFPLMPRYRVIGRLGLTL
jgi:hypothetical protein